jgi:DNA-binding CsgD family transcriptional regulator
MNTNTDLKTLTLLRQNLDGTDLAQPLAQLREREIVLLCHLTTNPTNEEVADKMCIRPKSVENYKTRISDKLELRGPHAVFRFVLKNCEFFKSLATVFLPPAQRAEQRTENREQRDAHKKIKLRGYPLTDYRFEPLSL